MRAYRFLGTTDEVTTCDCCGRSDLKSTVALENTETGENVFFGVVCAARALKITAKEVKADAKKANDEKAEAVRREREAADKAESARWTAHLVSRTGGIKDFRGDLDIFAMIQKIGGYTAAREGYAG